MRNKLSIKALIALIVFIISFTVSSIPASAYDDDYYGGDHTDQERFEYENDDTGYCAVILDYGDYLTDSEAKECLSAMKKITEYCNVLYVSDNGNGNGSKAQNYAEKMLKDEFGSKKSAVCYVAYFDYDYIYAQNEAYDTITSAKARSIADNIYELSEEDWSLSCKEAFVEILATFEGKHIAEPMKYICNSLLALLVSLLVCYFIVDSNSKLKSATTIEMATGAVKNVRPGQLNVTLTDQTRVYSPRSSGSSGGGHGGGGHHGGGGGHGH